MLLALSNISRDPQPSSKWWDHQASLHLSFISYLIRILVPLPFSHPIYIEEHAYPAQQISFSQRPCLYDVRQHPGRFSDTSARTWDFRSKWRSYWPKKSRVDFSVGRVCYRKSSGEVVSHLRFLYSTSRSKRKLLSPVIWGGLIVVCLTFVTIFYCMVSIWWSTFVFR